MSVTKHISIDKEYVEKLKPQLERHNGNFSAAIRDIIDRNGKSIFPNNSSAIDTPIFKWMLAEVEGILIPDNILDELIDPILMNSIRNLEECLNSRFSELEWNIDIEFKYDNDTFPSGILIEIKGDTQKIHVVACILSQYMVKNSLGKIPLEIMSVINLNECIKVELARSNKKDAQNSLITFFGQRDEMIKGINSRPNFWKSIVKRHLLSNFNMVTVHRNFFEDLLSNNIPLGEISIENMAKKPIQEIPLKEMLLLIKEVYETSRVIDKVEIDSENLIIFHSYRSNEAIEKIKKTLVTLLHANGHLYDPKSTANMIVLTHRPDVGIKVNEIVDHLKTSTSSFDQELLMFMTFLKGLKNIPDIPLSFTALGRKVGMTLMQEYEKENGIKNWNLENFKNVFEIINSRLHMESEWKQEGENLLYTVRKCHLTTEGNKIDLCICQTSREAFKGALNYAFGNRAVFEVKKLISHGDKLCEVVIRLT
jgi:predicted hydrocarbon binding protein